MVDSSEIVLCCLLWAHDGEGAGLSEYEDRVLRLIPNHGGVILQRAVSDGADGNPHEVQLYRFPDAAALDAYLADPQRLELASERNRVVRRTELFPIELR